jgi:glycosyltransferase involved in cell wall biosynthesis
MKVLMIGHSFPRHPADLAGAFLLALARGQQALGHEILVVAPHDGGLSLEDEIEGVRVIRYRYGADDAETLAYRGTMADQVLRDWTGRLRLLSFLTAQRRAVRQALGTFAPDVVHVHWWFPGGLAVWPRALKSFPIVLTSHGTDLFLVDRVAAARVIAAPLFRAVDEVTVISTPLVKRVIAFGVDPSRITVLPMPIDREVAAVAERDDSRRSLAAGGPPTLLFVGRLVERKGASYAVRAFAELVDAGRDARLVIVGDGPERQTLADLAHALGVGKRVELVGAVSPADVRPWYERASVLVMPAVTDWKGEQEGFGMVIVEAMSYGVPVVASRSGGIPDIVRDGENGLLVHERDIGGLAGAIARVLDDPALAGRLGARGQQTIRDEFAPTRIAEGFDSVYRRAVARPG